MIKNMKGVAILIGGDGNDDLTGAKGDDLILGGAGIACPGPARGSERNQSGDTFHSSKGKDVYFGGSSRSLQREET